MTSCCLTCKSSLGLTRYHAALPCPVLASLWCSQCSASGHTAITCDRVVHVTRPRTLEELIPADVRARWGITTHTLIVYPTEMSLEDKEREIGDGSVIEIRYGPSMTLDSSLRTYMKAQRPKIDTVHKMEGNLLKLRMWAVGQGKKIRILQG